MDVFEKLINVINMITELQHYRSVLLRKIKFLVFKMTNISSVFYENLKTFWEAIYLVHRNLKTKNAILSSLSSQ